MSSGDQLPISRIGKPDYNLTLEAGRRVVGPKTRCGEILAELIRHRETRSVQLDKQRDFVSEFIFSLATCIYQAVKCQLNL